MPEEFKNLKKDIGSLSSKNNIVCFLLYGSIISNRGNADDLDGILVVKKVDSSLNDLFELLASRYSKLDLNIYSHEEVTKDLSFYTREFKLEYLSKGICVYGKNLFKDEFEKVSKKKYRQSILIRSIEHLQMVRQKYFMSSIDDEQKIKYLKKYFIRISKNLLLFKGTKDYTSVNKMNINDIMKELVGVGIFDRVPNLENAKSVDEIFNLYKIISEALIRCKAEIEPTGILNSLMKKIYNN